MKISSAIQHLIVIAAAFSLALSSQSASADLVFIDTGNDPTNGYVNPVDDGSNGGTAMDDIADDGLTTLTYTQSFTSATSGVSYDLAFDLSSTGGFLNAFNVDNIGVQSDTVAETTAGTAGSLNPSNGEALTVNNISLSNINGGSAVFSTINRVGLAFATGGSDEGTFDVGASTITFDTLEDGDPFVSGSIDSAGESFDLRAANGSDFSEFTLAATGGAFRLDAIEFEVITTSAVPEPSSLAMFMGLVAVAATRRRRS